MRREDGSPPATTRRSPGMSRENSSTSRPGSSLSSRPATTPGSAGGGSAVRLRPGSSGGRRQRPLSIATTGMTASMYEERQRPEHRGVQLRPKTGTPKIDRMKRARSVTSDAGGLEDDNRSVTSSQSVGPSGRGTPGRKTPSMVKAEDKARKAKATPVTSTGNVSRSPASTPKSSLGARSKGAAVGGEQGSKESSPVPSLQENSEEGGEKTGDRQSTPDIIKDNNNKTKEEVMTAEVDVKEKERQNEQEKEHAEEKEVPAEQKEEKIVIEEKEKTPDNGEVNGADELKKKIITSEEEARAKIAEKRREMKELKEREEREREEQERLQMEEERRLEEEQRKKEEEEEKAMEKLAEEGRRAEEERIDKAIREREEEEKKVREDEEKQKREKEEQEKKSKEDAEKREVELQDKLKKEEEERLARKKRIEEIMARTRGGKGGGAAAAKKEMSSPQPSQPPSLDPLGDPTTPDLLGDISQHKVDEENARNLALAPQLLSPVSPAEAEQEKGALDSLSLKSEDTENSSPLITIDTSVPIKKSNGVVEGGNFEQILDLGEYGDSKEERAPGVPSPVRAFEEIPAQNIQDLLS